MASVTSVPRAPVLELNVPNRENPGAKPSAAAVNNAQASSRFYLPELDILRFFAFLWMFFVHASITFPASDTNASPRIVDAGFYTVDLFFALSAYLLTQLLVRELARRGKADVRAFYLRRLLRIWPLYFFFLSLAFVLSHTFGGSPYASSFTARSTYFVAYVFFVGNYANAWMGPPIVILSPLWTICTEEQVYLVLPWLIRKATPLGIAAAGTALVVAANFTRVEFAFHYSSGIPVWFNTLTHLDSIGIGILLAAVPREWFSRLARSRRIALAALGVGCWLVAVNYYNSEIAADTPWQEILSYPLGAIGSGAILAAFIGASGGQITSLPGRFLVYLGKISYGLYVFHGLGITLIKVICDPTLSRNIGSYHILQLVDCALSLIVILAMAACSYKWLEAPFLRLKERFTVVASRPV
jgi:peptidoglycan/LPS O-acetylase OafA/YrhL